jgi:carbamoyl-phosphate synthase large subunit
MALTILRTAAGSAPSVTQYQSFQQHGIRVVAVDSDPLSVGFAFADASYVVPRANAPGYFDALARICKQERVNWVLPGLDEELVLVASRAQELESCGTRVLGPSVESLQICTDKLRTHDFFREHSIPTPDTWNGEKLTASEIRTYPKIVKPRSGRGSSQVFVARNETELRFFLGYVPQPVVQTLLVGTELTIDVLCDFESRPLFVRPRLRLQTDSGISYKAATTSNAQASKWASMMASQLALVGPCNIQCFVNERGDIHFTEINARLAGSVALTFFADPPFLQALCDLLAGREVSSAIEPVEPRVMLRYWSELYIDPAQAARLCRQV